MTSQEQEIEELVTKYLSKFSKLEINRSPDFDFICDETNNSENDKRANRLNITIEYRW